MSVTDPQGLAKRPRLLVDIWAGFRPYLVRFSVDFLISAFLWIALYLFKLLTTWLEIEGWPAEFMHAAHSAGVASAAIVFAILFVLDIYALHGSRHV
jgi:hypothetical protein